MGTTYSGHPTATSLCNTLRNLIYHLVAYADAFGLNPEGGTNQIYNVRSIMEAMRKYYVMRFAGDDSVVLGKSKSQVEVL